MDEPLLDTGGEMPRQQLQFFIQGKKPRLTFGAKGITAFQLNRVVLVGRPRARLLSVGFPRRPTLRTPRAIVLSHRPQISRTANQGGALEHPRP